MKDPDERDFDKFEAHVPPFGATRERSVEDLSRRVRHELGSTVAHQCAGVAGSTCG